MKRPVFVWLIFGLCLLAATAAVGWLTQSVLNSERLAEQGRQQALFESELRNALWRMDSLVAPLIAIESGRPFIDAKRLKLASDSPVLTSKLVKSYVIRTASAQWWQLDSKSHAITSLADDSTLVLAAKSFESISSEGIPQTAPDGFFSPDALLNGLVTWPQPAIGQASQGTLSLNNVSGAEAQNRTQLVQQFSQLAQRSLQQPIIEKSPLPSFPSQLRARWFNGELVLGRSSENGASEFAILNWPEWESLLHSQLGSLQSRVRLVPMHVSERPDADAANERQMVSLPIRLDAQFDEPRVNWPQSLFVVWGLLFFAAIAVGWLMFETLSLSERRAAFVSAVTHELRTPLTTFRLYSEMLSDGLVTDPNQQQTYFRTLHREANRLMHLVENVLSFARLERGRATARNETLKGGDLIERCASRLQQRVAETSLTLTIQITDDARIAQVTTNAMAVEQVLFNLIDNACKYAKDTSDPRVVCDVHVTGGQLCVRVLDFGPGLSDAACQTLFQPFQKSSSQAAESAPGIGLGLALSHRLARELGGSLTCTANHPTGLCFELRLPAVA